MCFSLMWQPIAETVSNKQLLKVGAPVTDFAPTIQCAAVPLPKLRHWVESSLGITE